MKILRYLFIFLGTAYLLVTCSFIGSTAKEPARTHVAATTTTQLATYPKNAWTVLPTTVSAAVPATIPSTIPSKAPVSPATAFATTTSTIGAPNTTSTVAGGAGIRLPTTTTTPPPATTTTTTTTTVPTTTTTRPRTPPIDVPCGNYGSLDLSGKNGTASDPIIYRGNGCARLVGRGWQIVLIANASYLTLDGFEIVGPERADDSGPHDPTSGVEIRNSHHITISNNYVHDLGGGGIAAIRSNHVTIDGNTVAHTSRWNGYQTSGISTYNAADIGGPADGYSYKITNNTVSDAINMQGAISDGNCIIIDDGRWTQNTGTPFRGSTYVAWNTCTANGGRCVHVFQSDNVTAEYNWCDGNVLNVANARGELTAVFASNVMFSYNTVTPNVGIPVLYEHSATNVVFTP